MDENKEKIYVMHGYTPSTKERFYGTTVLHISKTGIANYMGPNGELQGTAYWFESKQFLIKLITDNGYEVIDMTNPQELPSRS